MRTLHSVITRRICVALSAELFSSRILRRRCTVFDWILRHKDKFVGQLCGGPSCTELSVGQYTKKLSYRRDSVRRPHSHILSKLEFLGYI